MQTPGTQTDLEYTATPATGRRYFSTTIPLFIVCFAALILLSYLVLFWVPYHLAIFRDFHTPLPAFTLLVLNASSTIQSHGLWFLLAGIAIATPFAMGALLTTLHSDDRRRTFRRIIIWAVILLTAITAALIYVGMSVPIWTK